MAEDLAATRLVRAAGLKVRLVRRPFAQPLGARRLGEVWRRQLRWSRVRRMGFPGYFAAEILTGAFLPLIGGLWLVGGGRAAGAGADRALPRLVSRRALAGAGGGMAGVAARMS